MGMLLSVPLMLAGLAFIAAALRRPRAAASLRALGALAARNRNPPAHRAGRADAGAAITWRCASAIPQHGYYMTRDPLGRAGDFITAPEISQMFGELVGLWAASVWQLMGAAGERAAGRARPRPRHHDARRAARRAGGAGVSLGHRGASGRDQARCCGERQQQALSGIDVPMMWHQTFDEVPDGPGHRARQRILRRAAGASGDQAVRRLARARGRDRRRRQSHVSASPTNRSRCSISCVPPSVRDAPIGAIYEWRTDNLPLALGQPHGATGRRRAGDRLWPCRRARSATRCRRSAATPSPIRSAARARSTSPPMSISRRLRQAAESMGARVHGPIEQAQFLRRARHREARRGA